MKFSIQNLHLAISVAIILPTAIVYGTTPAPLLTGFFDFTVATRDLSNIFRAIMGLYIAMTAIWIAGIVNKRCWRLATIVNVCFMGGLAFGRVISLVLDGVPSQKFLVGLLLEAALAVWGLVNLHHDTRRAAKP